MLWHEWRTGGEIQKHGMREDRSWGVKHGCRTDSKGLSSQKQMTCSEGIVGSLNGFSSLVLKDSTPEYWETYKWGHVENRLYKLSYLLPLPSLLILNHRSSSLPSKLRARSEGHYFWLVWELLEQEEIVCRTQNGSANSKSFPKCPISFSGKITRLVQQENVLNPDFSKILTRCLIIAMWMKGK